MNDRTVFGSDEKSKMRGRGSVVPAVPAPDEPAPSISSAEPAPDDGHVFGDIAAFDSPATERDMLPELPGYAADELKQETARYVGRYEDVDYWVVQGERTGSVCVVVMPLSTSKWLTGCGGIGPGDTYIGGGTPGATEYRLGPQGLAPDGWIELDESTPAPTPTCAVPEQPGVEPLEGCVVYDGEANMAFNELYRERMEMTDAARAVGEEYVGPLTSALTAWRDTGPALTEDGARDVFAEAGFDVEVVEVRESQGEVLFGVGIDGGCVFGALTPDAVAVDVGGYIMDGGCLAAVGH
jgi:hypothetical protein